MYSTSPAVERDTKLNIHWKRRSMEQFRGHYIAVIGGFRQLNSTQVEAAKSAATTLGAELAKAKLGLVVYFSDEASLEPHVVEGYVGALAKAAPLGAIRVRYAESQSGQVKFAEQTIYPDLFDRRLFPGQDWEAPFYRSLAEEDGVDGVLLVAGGPSTLVAGQIAVGRHLPVLAVEAFGGSAAKIWNHLAQVSLNQNYPSWATRAPPDLVKQLNEECAAAAARRQEARRKEERYAAITTQRHQTVFAAGAFLALLATLILGVLYTSSPAYPVVMLLGLISAGATGALARTLIWGSEGKDPWTSLLLGGLAGIVVGLAYLIPHLVGAPLTLTPTEAESPIARIEFLSTVLVAISAGIGFDTVFSRLREQAKDEDVGPKSPGTTGSTRR